MATADPARNTRASNIHWAYRAIMLLGGVTVGLALTALTPVLPQIEAALAHSPGDRLLIKLLVTGVGLTMMVGAPLAGFLSDRIGMKRVLLAGCILYAVAGTAGLYLDDLFPLMVSRLLVGLGASAIAATAMTLINSKLDGVGRAKWMGGHVAAATIGTLILHPAAGALGEIGWRLPFALYSFGFVLAGIALCAPPSTVVGAADRRNEHVEERLTSWFPFRFAFLAIGIGGITYIPVVYLPFVARDIGVSSPLVISLIGLGDALLSVIMAIQFGRARRRISSSAAFAFSFACTAIGMIVTGFASSFAGMVIGMGIFGLGIGWFVPNLMTAAAACVAAHQQGRTVGIIKGAHYFAAPACTVLIDPVTRQFGSASALWVAGMISFGLFVLFLLPSTRRSAPSAASA